MVTLAHDWWSLFVGHHVQGSITRARVFACVTGGSLILQLSLPKLVPDANRRAAGSAARLHYDSLSSGPDGARHDLLVPKAGTVDRRGIARRQRVLSTPWVCAG
jgi:hypothetical protein